MSHGEGSAVFVAPGASASGEPTDAEAIAPVIRDHSQDAFAVIYRRHAAMIKCACQRILGAGAGEVDDALQNTFLVLARRAREVDGRTVGAWLHGVAIRCARQLLRERTRRTVREERVALSSPSEQPAREAELAPSLDLALARLSPTLRQAVILCHLEDLSLRDAAVQAGCPVATMGWRSAEGLKRLRSELQRRRGACDLGVVTGLLATQAKLAHALAIPAAPAAPAAAIHLGMLASIGAATLAATAAVCAGALALGAGVNHAATVPAGAAPTATAAAPIVLARQGLPIEDQRLTLAAPITVLAFAPDGSLAVGLQDGDIQLLDADSGSILRTLHGHTRAVSSLAWSPDGLYLVSGGTYGDSTLRLWPMRGGEPRTLIQIGLGNLESLQFSPDGTALLSGEDNVPAVHMWDVGSWQRLPNHPDYPDLAHTVRFSPDGSLFASAGRDRFVHVWKRTDMSQVAAWPFDMNQIRAIAFSPDGAQLCAAGGVGGDLNGIIRRWRFPSGEALPDLPMVRSDVATLAFSPDGSVLACGGEDLELFDASSGRLLGILASDCGRSAHVAFDSGGRRLVCTTVDGALRRWHTRLRCGPGRPRGGCGAGASLGRRRGSWPPRAGDEAQPLMAPGFDREPARIAAAGLGIAGKAPMVPEVLAWEGRDHRRVGVHHALHDHQLGVALAGIGDRQGTADEQDVHPCAPPHAHPGDDLHARSAGEHRWPAMAVHRLAEEARRHRLLLGWFLVGHQSDRGAVAQRAQHGDRRGAVAMARHEHAVAQALALGIGHGVDRLRVLGLGVDQEVARVAHQAMGPEIPGAEVRRHEDAPASVAVQPCLPARGGHLEVALGSIRSAHCPQLEEGGAHGGIGAAGDARAGTATSTPGSAFELAVDHAAADAQLPGQHPEAAARAAGGVGAQPIQDAFEDARQEWHGGHARGCAALGHAASS